MFDQDKKQAFENLYATLAESTDLILHVDGNALEKQNRKAQLRCIQFITTSPVWRNGWKRVADYDAIMLLSHKQPPTPKGWRPKSMRVSRLEPVLENDWLSDFAAYLTAEQGVYLASAEDLPSLEYIAAMGTYTLHELDALWPIEGQPWPYASLYEQLFGASIPTQAEKEA